MAVRFPLDRTGRSGRPVTTAGSEAGAGGVESECCTAFGAAEFAALVDVAALVSSAAVLELVGTAEVGASDVAVVGAVDSAFLGWDLVVALGWVFALAVVAFFVPLPDPVRVAAALFLPVLLLADVLAPEDPLEDAVVRRAAGFLGVLVGWSVLMTTTVRRVPRGV